MTMETAVPSGPELLARLAVALGIGLMIGLERGWKLREADEGGRVAGIRTFALIGLSGGVWGALALSIGEFVIAAALLALAALLMLARWSKFKSVADLGVTTDVAALLTFALGLFAVRVDMTIAAAVGVIVVTLLEIKDRLHRAIARIRDDELVAVIRLLLISMVVLPVLPNEGLGPGGALNPFALWWMVVLVAGLSLAGYWAVKLIGARRGLLITGLFGGLASSTALTASLSRVAARAQTGFNVVASGVAMAMGTMFVRLFAVTAVVNRALALELAVPFAATVLTAYGGAYVLARRKDEGGQQPALSSGPPLELMPALIFGAILAAVTLLVHVAGEAAGAAGIYGLAALSAFVDVDAIGLSMAQAAQREVALGTAVNAVLIAAYVNTVWKIGLAAALGSAAFAMRVAAVVMPALIVGAAAVLLG